MRATHSKIYGFLGVTLKQTGVAVSFLAALILAAAGSCKPLNVSVLLVRLDGLVPSNASIKPDETDPSISSSVSRLRDRSKVSDCRIAES